MAPGSLPPWPASIMMVFIPSLTAVLLRMSGSKTVRKSTSEMYGSLFFRIIGYRKCTCTPFTVPSR